MPTDQFYKDQVKNILYNLFPTFPAKVLESDKEETIAEAVTQLVQLHKAAIAEAEKQVFNKIFEMAANEKFEHWTHEIIIDLSKLEEELAPPAPAEREGE